MPTLIEDDIYKTGESFCNISIKLLDQVKKIRRQYIRNNKEIIKKK